MTSVLSNFICDSVSSVPPDQVLNASNTEISSFVETLHRYCLQNQSSVFIVVPPLARKEPHWFNSYLPCFTAFLISEISRRSTSQIRCLSPFITPDTFFESDGVHLTHDAGLQFIQYIISGVDQVYPVPNPLSQSSSGSISSFPSAPNIFSQAPPPASIPLTNQGPASVQTGEYSGFSQASQSSQGSNPVVSSLQSGGFAVEFGRISSALNTLTGLTSTMRTEAQERRRQDNLIFARLKEDRDFEFNKNRENRFTLTGLVTDPSPPSDPRERKDFYVQKLQELVDEACPAVEPRPIVEDVFVNLRRGQDSPFLEGRMDSAASSLAFRIAASNLAKVEGSHFGNYFIANSVTLSTRVRIEILRAISKVLVTDATDSYVQGFSSRPLLHYHLKDGCSANLDGVNRTYTFVEAVAKFGHLVSSLELHAAYRRARPAFNGCMEQYFVLLKESSSPDAGSSPPVTGSNQYPVGTRGRGTRRGGTSFRSRARFGGRAGRGGFPGPNGRGAASSETRKRPLTAAAFSSTPSKRSQTQTSVSEPALPSLSVSNDDTLTNDMMES